ncbi:hypothetical protein E4T39_02705 [Aureobasidium subglaciale]|nr:hypothetical protein E4T39_02705 [Aureobasidium subglaciale]
MNGSQSRNPSDSASMHDARGRKPSQAPAPGQSATNTTMTRAERFEDEKRRMVESCFSKLDQNGQLAESYITHIRITEDAAHPSTPPPPTSAPDNKKPRIIVVAVRSTGRVRMHKARENNNGSFSIGKTWNLEDLSAIESFAHVDPNAPPPKQNHYQWASNVGFVVTISKPYYWEASTSKEKDFFVASLVKIYRKYTKGQVPDLRGFDPRDVEQMLGLAPGQQQAPRSSPALQDRQTPQNTPPPRAPFADPNRPPSQDSRQRLRPTPENGQAPLSGGLQPQPRPSQDRGLRQPSRERMQKPSRDPMRAPSREPMRAQSREPGARAPSREPGQRAPPPALNNGPPPGARPRLTPKSSRAELQQPLMSDSPNTSFASSVRTIPTVSDQPPPHFNQPPPPQPGQLAPARAEGRQQSYQSVRSERSIQSQRSQESTDAPPTEASMFTSTLNHWKPPSREASPMRQPSPSKPHPANIDQSEPRPSVFETLKNQRQPAATSQRERQPSITPPDQYPNDIQVPPERKRPFMAGGRKYSAAPSENESDSEALRPPPLSTSRNVSGASTNISTVATVGRSSSPRGLGIEKHLPMPSSSDRVPGAFYDTPTASTADLSSQPQVPEPELRIPEPEQAPTLPSLEPDEPPALMTDSRDVLSDEEAHRPGLGPMIKKKNGPKLADALRKAAAAQGAFKPRAGGAAERMRLLAEAATKGQGPDGITGVVPAPLRKKSVDIDRADLPVSPMKAEFPTPVAEVVPEAETRSIEPEILPKVMNETAHAHKPVDGAAVEGYFPQPEPEQQPQEPEVPLVAPEPRRPKRRSAQQENHLRSLNIDPRLLDGRGIQFESILSDFGWGSGVLKGRQLEDLEADLKRELGRVEAGSWLGHLEQKDDRVDVVDQMLDRAIAECDELDGLLTIYSAELSTLNEDISFIEAQSQGLQVQTANQKILHTELQKLVDTISISPRQLEPLRHADFGNPEALMSVESSLLLLYKAMATIDPSVRSTNALSRSGPAAGLDTSDIGSMNALQEKRNAYMRESAEFCQRLMRYMDHSFASALGAAKPALLQHPGGVGNATMKLNGSGFNLARANLWQFSPLLLFTKETNMPAWQSTLRTYHTKARPLYTDVFRDNTNNWKKGARTATGEATELLFTSVEKETSEGLTSTARKLTVKRSQTLAKSFRSAGSGGDKPTAVDRAQPGRMAPFEVFNGVLEEQVPLISMEQNFIVDLFHATSLENIDFADAVAANVPEARMGPDLTGRRLMEPDRAMARRVSDVMEETFGFWKDELRALMEWANAGDPIQGVGVLTVLALHAYRLQETSQEFLLHNLNEISARLQTLFQKFVDEQIHAIEDTKVKIKKRKGVIAFMKIFPLFSNAVESTYLSAAREYDGYAAVLGARQLIDDAYIRINRAMWDSLKVIARESPTAVGVSASATTAHGLEYEDKEILNYHILLIENMNHYIEEVDDGGKEGSVLAEWKAKALMDRAEHMEEYVGRVVRRPLGKIIDFIEGAEALLAQKLTGPSIAARPLYSRHNTKKLLASHDSKAIRSGIDTLRKRIEKHFGDADEEALSRQMVAMVTKECVRRYDGVLERLEKVCAILYREDEKGVVIEWSREDTREGFKRV